MNDQCENLCQPEQGSFDNPPSIYRIRWSNLSRMSTATTYCNHGDRKFKIRKFRALNIQKCIPFVTVEAIHDSILDLYQSST